MIFPSFLHFHLVPSKRLLVAFDFYFLPAVVVGIVVAGTEIRAQACMSAKAAAACEYRAVAGCVDPQPPTPTLPPLHRVDVTTPPNPSSLLSSWSASVLPPAAQSPLCFPVTNANHCFVYSSRCTRLFSAPWHWFMSGTSVKDRPSLLDHTDQEKSDCHCEPWSCERGGAVAVLDALSVVLS